MVDGVNNRMSRQISQLSLLGRQIADTQTQISTGKKLLRPSDDVTASARIAQLRRTQAANEGWQVNLDLANSLNSQAQTTVTNASERVARLSELLITAASEKNDTDRASIANEIRNIATTLDELAATRSSLDKPLFEETERLQIRVGPGTTLEPLMLRGEIFDRGGVKLSDDIRAMADAVENNDQAAMDAAIDDAVEIVSHLADASGQLGLISQRIERLSGTIFDRGVDVKKELSDLADTDLTEAVARLNQQTLTLEAAQAAFARINRRTLMDLIG